MIYVKWALMLVLDLVLLIFTALPAAIIVPLFTRSQQWGKEKYTWGWIWGTYDNPPQGDQGYYSKRAPFLNEMTGLKGYVNRVFWMLRNPLYGLALRMSLPYSSEYHYEQTGNMDISDKYKIPGIYMVKVFDKKGGKLVGFEYYCVKPWSETRDLRARLGWKIATDKFQERGFAQFVGTCNPFDGYGDD